jgi:LysM repeat protein
MIETKNDGNQRTGDLLRKNSTAMLVLFFVALIFADIILAFYLLRRQINPALIPAPPQQRQVFLPAILNVPEPAQPALRPATPTPPVKKYIVQRGDTLFSIALAHGVLLDDLILYNDIKNPDLIYVGQELLIPPGGTPMPTRTKDLQCDCP